MHGYERRTVVKKINSVALLIIAILLLNLIAILPGCRMNVAETGSTITGRSVEAPSGDGVPFIRVLLAGDNDTRFRVTDSDGYYTMFHVPKGNYTMTFAWFGFELFSTSVAVTENDLIYTVGLPQLSSGLEGFQGTINDVNGSISNATVRLIYPSGAIAQTESDQFGAYLFENLPDSEGVIVVAQADGYVSQVIEDIKIGFEGTRILDFELNPVVAPEVGRLFGTVKDKDGENLVDVYIGVFPAGTVPSILAIATAEVLTDETGFNIPKVPAGSYTVLCIKSGFAPESEIVVVENGGEYTFSFVLDTEEEIWRQSTRIGE